MSIADPVVSRILRSPLHGLMSSSTDLVRYTGRRSGRTFTTPTQYAHDGDDVVILVGRPETKVWWRNFTGGGDLELLLAGTWVPMRGEAVVGGERPDEVAALLATYLDRFPRAVRTLDGETPQARARHAVVVRCRPRLPNS